MMGVLTVRENLQFSAALRLPSHMTCKQRRERVERVIEELGLQICADTKVQGGYIPYKQAKRCDSFSVETYIIENACTYFCNQNRS